MDIRSANIFNFMEEKSKHEIEAKIDKNKKLIPSKSDTKKCKNYILFY